MAGTSAGAKKGWAGRTKGKAGNPSRFGQAGNKISPVKSRLGRKLTNKQRTINENAIVRHQIKTKASGMKAKGFSPRQVRNTLREGKKIKNNPNYGR